MVQLSQTQSHPQRVQNRGQAFVLRALNSTTASELCEWAVDIVKSKACSLRVFPAIHMPTTTTSSFLKKFIFIVLCGQPIWSWTQPDLEGCVWTAFKHANGSVASEGCLVNGVPAGVWKSFSDQGVLLSEGARRNNKPHGLWRFYNEGGLRETSEYDEGQKHGWQTLWTEGALTDSVFWSRGMREQWSTTFRKDGSKRMVVPFEKDEREGKATLFNVKNEPHGYRWFKNDRLVASESFNRFNDQGLKEGPWKVFHPTGRLIETGFFVDGLAHGVFQYFDARGSLVRVREFRFGEEVVQEESREPVIELQEIRREDGTLAETVTYVDGVKQGVARRFDNQGQVVGGSVFANDALVAEGITLKDGTREGPWKDYWVSGSLKSEGWYENDLREGVWVFYRESGEKEQEGSYRSGKVHGRWTWWYPGGNIHRSEEHHVGKLDGEFLELDTAGEAIVSGQYVDGERDGVWRLKVNDHLEEGRYVLGQKDGLWVHTYGSGKRQFEGEFSLGQPSGRHRTWHPNGVLEEEGRYEGGAKHKKWRLYDAQGSVLHEYIYRYGKLRKVDGSKVDKRRDGKLKSN